MTRYFGVLFASLACMLTFTVVSQATTMIDDFEDGDLSEWSTTSGDPIGADVTAAAAHDGNYGVELGTDRTGWIFRLDSAAWVGWGDTFGAWTRVNYEMNGRTYFGFGVPYDYAGYSVIVGYNTQSFVLQYNGGLGMYEILVEDFMTILLNHWYRIEVEWGDGGVITANLYDSDGTTLLNSITTVDTRITEGGVSLRSFGGTTSYFDTITREDGCTPAESSTWGKVKSLYH